VLERVGLHDRSAQIAGDLSYGHQRLLEIAMGLVQDPKVFILDEPTQGLAESEVQGFMALMRDLAGGTTILLIEHNMSVVMQTADHITVLNQGRILANGTPEAIRADSHVQAAYLGVADA
jgi:branched-chain amino acid transport system ATP-binding protein